MKKLIKNTIIKTYCLRICCQGTPKRAVHAEGRAVSINTKVKSEDTKITDSRNRRHRSLPPRPVALRRRNPGIRVCARFLAVVGVDASVTNTSHLVVALRVRQTAHSMKIGSADTAFVVRKQRRARRVVRLRYAERTRCTRHRAAGSIAESCVSR